jgi:hypothetical protein
MKRKLATTDAPKRFVRSAKSAHLLAINDVVLLDVPIEMEIMNAVPVGAHGNIAKIISEVKSNSEEVEVMLMQLEQDDDYIDMFVPKRQRVQSICVPKFCVCLEEQTLRNRLQES